MVEMTITERYERVLSWFEANMPVAESELHYKSPYELLVAVVLSAKCTDKRVNEITPHLFKRFPDPKSLSDSTAEEVFKYIRSVSYPNNKSRHLAAMGKMLVAEFNSVVPDNVDDLQKLPGVGRKSANVIASVIYDKPVIAVDTHVFRVSRRVGLSEKNTPLGVELDLTANIPENRRAIAHHWLILHGRYICVARKPKCSECGLRDYCLHYHISGTTDLHKGSSGRRSETAAD